MISTSLAVMAVSSVTFFSDLADGQEAFLLDSDAVCMYDKKLVLSKDALVTTNYRYAYLVSDQELVMHKGEEIAYSAGLTGAGATEAERLTVLGNLTESMKRSCDPNIEYVEITVFGDSGMKSLDAYVNSLLTE